MFDKNSETLLNWFENLEERCQNLLYDKRYEWFQSALEKNDIETAFNSSIRIYKSGKYYFDLDGIRDKQSAATIKRYDYGWNGNEDRDYINGPQNNMNRYLGDPEKKKEFLEDISVATGGTFINELKGTKLENVTLGQLGQAKKVVVTKDSTIIIEGLKNSIEYNELVESIKELESKEEGTEQKEKLKKRIARLTGSVATLSVGATTEVEMKEKKDRVDDACRATRSAIETGFVVGAGTAFLRIPLPIVKDSKLMKGYNLVFDCLEKSLEQICINAGQNAELIIKEVKESGSNYGYNAKTDSIEDLLASGIIEPAKSNICALQNAASIVCQILSSQYMITDVL